MALGYALSSATLTISLLKWLVGGFRPHFLAVCDPPIPSSSEGINNSV